MVTREVLDRFSSKVSPEPNSGCYLWTSTIDEKGYGRFWLDGGNVKAHRYALQLEGVAIPSGMQVDHVCRVRSCVNPRHLRVVTSHENTFAANSQATAKLKREQTHCKHGHEYTPENTFWRALGGRDCRKCMRMRQGLTPEKLDPRFCRRGHEFTPENTKITARGTRLCRTCVRIMKRRAYHQ